MDSLSFWSNSLPFLKAHTSSKLSSIPSKMDFFDSSSPQTWNYPLCHLNSYHSTLSISGAAVMRLTLAGGIHHNNWSLDLLHLVLRLPKSNSLFVGYVVSLVGLALVATTLDTLRLVFLPFFDKLDSPFSWLEKKTWWNLSVKDFNWSFSGWKFSISPKISNRDPVSSPFFPPNKNPELGAVDFSLIGRSDGTLVAPTTSPLSIITKIFFSPITGTFSDGGLPFCRQIWPLRYHQIGQNYYHQPNSGATAIKLSWEIWWMLLQIFINTIQFWSVVVFMAVLAILKAYLV